MAGTKSNELPERTRTSSPLPVSNATLAEIATKPRKIRSHSIKHFESMTIRSMPAPDSNDDDAKNHTSSDSNDDDAKTHTSSTRSITSHNDCEPDTASSVACYCRALSAKPSSPKKRFASATQPPGSPTKKSKASQFHEKGTGAEPTTRTTKSSTVVACSDSTADISSDEEGPHIVLADGDNVFMGSTNEDPVIGESLLKKELEFGSLSSVSELNIDIAETNSDGHNQVNKSSNQLQGDTHGKYLGYEITGNNGITRRMKGKDNEKSEDESMDGTAQVSETASEVLVESPQSDVGEDLREENVAEMIRKWEFRLLDPKDPNARVVIRVGKDGQDEFQRSEPYSKKRFTLIARGIIAAGPTTEPIKQAHDSSNGKWRGTQFLLLLNLAKVTDMNDIRAFPAFFRIRSRKLLKDRVETFRCLACHPVYLRASADDQKAYKQNLIYFFDKRFTDQIRMLTGRLNLGIFLRLGNDSAFSHEDDLNTGGEEGDAMVDRNVTIWAESLKYSYLSGHVDVARSTDGTTTCEQPFNISKEQWPAYIEKMEGQNGIKEFLESEERELAISMLALRKSLSLQKPLFKFNVATCCEENITRD